MRKQCPNFMMLLLQYISWPLGVFFFSNIAQLPSTCNLIFLFLVEWMFFLFSDSSKKLILFTGMAYFRELWGYSRVLDCNCGIFRFYTTARWGAACKRRIVELIAATSDGMENGDYGGKCKLPSDLLVLIYAIWNIKKVLTQTSSSLDGILLAKHGVAFLLAVWDLSSRTLSSSVLKSILIHVLHHLWFLNSHTP